QTPRSAAPQVTVLGAFVGGGGSLGDARTVQQHVEIHDYVSRTFNTHSIRAGGRLRLDATTDNGTRNFNGTFTISSPPGLPNQAASQFSMAAGDPVAADTMTDVGLFVQDDWRVRSNLTASAGLRVETQTDIALRADIAPRTGVAWSVGRAKKGAGAPWVV